MTIEQQPDAEGHVAAALFSLHYHSCKAGHPVWRRKVDAIELADENKELGARLLRDKVLDIAEAGAILTDSAAIESALAGQARTYDEPGAQFSVADRARHLQEYSVAMLARGAYHARGANSGARIGPGDPFTTTFERHFADGYRLTPEQFDGALHAAGDANDAFSKIYNELGFSDFALKDETGEDLGVTHVRVEGTALRSGGSVSDIQRSAVVADPRAWKTTIPATFTESEYVLDPKPRVVFEKPRLDLIGPPHRPALGSTRSGFFFEQVGLRWAPNLALTQFRNLLWVDFTVQAERLDLAFNLVESLSSDLLGVTRQAGIDVDNGYGFVQFGNDKVTIAAEKNARFDDDLLNVLALPFLQLWLGLMVVSGLRVYA